MTEKNKTKETPKMYYGAYEIVNVKKDGKEKRVQIKFLKPRPVKGKGYENVEDHGEAFTIPEWELNVCSATKPCPEQEHLTELRNRRANYVAKRILQIFEELDFRVDDFGYLSRKLVDSMQMSEDYCTLKAFGVDSIDEVRISTWENAGKK